MGASVGAFVDAFVGAVIENTSATTTEMAKVLNRRHPPWVIVRSSGSSGRVGAGGLWSHLEEGNPGLGPVRERREDGVVQRLPGRGGRFDGELQRHRG